MKALLLLPLCLCGCALEFAGRERSLSLGLPKPPTNSVVGVSFTKVGIVIEQNPATGAPGATVGYVRGYYYRIPPYFDMTAGVTTTQDGMKTTINDSFSVWSTNR